MSDTTGTAGTSEGQSARCGDCGESLVWHQCRGDESWVMVDPRTGLPHHETCHARPRRSPYSEGLARHRALQRVQGVSRQDVYQSYAPYRRNPFSDDDDAA